MASEGDKPTAERRQSIGVTVGKEGKQIAKNSFSGKTLAVFTSGGDAQGTYTREWQPSPTHGTSLEM